MAGEGCIHEELLGLKFRISPHSFFQVRDVQNLERLFFPLHSRLVLTLAEPVLSVCAVWQVNTGAAEVLYSAVGEWAQLDQDSTVLDVCCGTGTIGISLAKVILVHEMLDQHLLLFHTYLFSLVYCIWFCW